MPSVNTMATAVWENAKLLADEKASPQVLPPGPMPHTNAVPSDFNAANCMEPP